MPHWHLHPCVKVLWRSVVMSCTWKFGSSVNEDNTEQKGIILEKKQVGVRRMKLHASVGYVSHSITHTDCKDSSYPCVRSILMLTIHKCCNLNYPNLIWFSIMKGQWAKHSRAHSSVHRPSFYLFNLFNIFSSFFFFKYYSDVHERTNVSPFTFGQTIN